jgi:hypothetical protein
VTGGLARGELTPTTVMGFAPAFFSTVDGCSVDAGRLARRVATVIAG